jgi:hypothetical protein
MESVWMATPKCLRAAGDAFVVGRGTELRGHVQPGNRLDRVEVVRELVGHQREEPVAAVGVCVARAPDVPGQETEKRLRPRGAPRAPARPTSRWWSSAARR